LLGVVVSPGFRNSTSQARSSIRKSLPVPQSISRPSAAACAQSRFAHTAGSSERSTGMACESYPGAITSTSGVSWASTVITVGVVATCDPQMRTWAPLGMLRIGISAARSASTVAHPPARIAATTTADPSRIRCPLPMRCLPPPNSRSVADLTGCGNLRQHSETA
jgi:hypothetical protein